MRRWYFLLLSIGVAVGVMAATDMPTGLWLSLSLAAGIISSKLEARGR